MQIIFYGQLEKCTGISSQIRTKLRDWAIWQARAGCYSQAALSSNDSKTLYCVIIMMESFKERKEFGNRDERKGKGIASSHTFPPLRFPARRKIVGFSRISFGKTQELVHVSDETPRSKRRMSFADMRWREPGQREGQCKLILAEKTLNPREARKQRAAARGSRLLVPGEVGDVKVISSRFPRGDR